MCTNQTFVKTETSQSLRDLPSGVFWEFPENCEPERLLAESSSTTADIFNGEAFNGWSLADLSNNNRRLQLAGLYQNRGIQDAWSEASSSVESSPSGSESSWCVESSDPQQSLPNEQDTELCWPVIACQGEELYDFTCPPIPGGLSCPPSYPAFEQTLAPRSNKWQCSQCLESFSKSYKLDTHAKESRHRAYSCESCGRSYVRQSTLARHRATAHGPSADHVCEHCSGPKSFRRRDHLRQHLREVHRRIDCL